MVYITIPSILNSNLKLRDAIARVNEIIDYSISIGHEVVAFTEHESVSNAIKIEEYYDKIKKDHPNFKVIRGNEIYLCRDGLNKDNFSKELGDKYYHFILLAKDAIGHKQIRELSTRAWNRSWMNGKMRRTPTYYQDLIDIVLPNSGHIIATTACLGGFLPTKLLEFRQNQNPQLYSNIKNWLSQIEIIFGKGNFYLEMQPSPDEDQIYVNQRIIELSKELNIPYIITTDAHYLKKEDAPIHKAFLNSQDGEREVESFYKTTYVMTTEELESYINSYLSEEEIQEAYKNILDIKNKCEDYSLKKSLKIPSLIWKEPISTIPEVEEYYPKIPYLKAFMESEFNGDRVMAKLVVDKLNSDSRLREDKIYNELNENLKTTWISSEVNKVHWSAYFLNLQKTIEECWNAGTLVGPGRGSGVGFLLLYIMDIIQINPLWETTKTFAWRFLNPDRVSVLD